MSMFCLGRSRNLIINTLVVVLLSLSCSESVFQQATENGTRSQGSQATPVSYKILKINCAKKGTCLVFAEVAEQFFTCKDMVDLAKKLKAEFQSKENVRVLLFDNAQSSAGVEKGNFEARDIEKLIRGAYEFDVHSRTERIRFALAKGHSWHEAEIDLNVSRSN